MDRGAWWAIVHRVTKSQTGQRACMCSIQFSCSVVSNSFRPHEPQHARPPCPLPTPRVYPNSRPLTSLVAQMVKRLPTIWETWVRLLVGEDPLEKEMAAHSSIHSCLENSVGGAWWTTAHGVTKSRTHVSTYSLRSFSSVQFSHSVVSDSLGPHESQHARHPCPSPAPRTCSNSCPSWL